MSSIQLHGQDDRHRYAIICPQGHQTSIADLKTSPCYDGLEQTFSRVDHERLNLMCPHCSPGTIPVGLLMSFVKPTTVSVAKGCSWIDNTTKNEVSTS